MVGTGWQKKEEKEEEDGQIKVHFYSLRIGHAGHGLIYGKILRRSRAVLEFRMQMPGVPRESGK